MTTKRIGDVTVTRVEESMGPFLPATEFFPDWKDSAVAEHRGWLEPAHFKEGMLLLSFHSWVIRTKHHVILVDTCGGNDKNRPGPTGFSRFHMQKHPYLDRLRAAGIKPEDVDYVLCTHLHGDQVGWNTQLVDGRWVPTFPKAKYVFSKTELDYWDPTRGLPDGSGGKQLAGTRFQITFDDSVLPIIESGQAMVVDGTHQLGDGLLIEPAPGHTPGHVTLKLSSQNQEGLFVGDILHHPIQVHFPDWNSRVCSLAEPARRTRRHVLEHCAEHNSLMIPAHFMAPYTVRIARKGERFSFAFE
jgi:glyoxylase-like metal-dependent hydrolase (beta-lactamase superfamily II)